MTDSKPDSFLGRWSRRKLKVKEGKAVEESVAALPAPGTVLPARASPKNPVSAASVATQLDVQVGVQVGAPDAQVPNSAATPAAPLPTLQDAAQLNQHSDFKPFMARGVSPEVKNLALKKLFADPHFNVMDGMDTYIDDYSIPSPLSPAILQMLEGAKFLGLVDDDEEIKRKALAKQQQGAQTLDVEVTREGTDGNAHPDVAKLPNAASPETVPSVISPLASTATPAPAVPPIALTDDDTNLRLQPDHAAGSQKAGSGAG